MVTCEIPQPTPNPVTGKNLGGVDIKYCLLEPTSHFFLSYYAVYFVRQMPSTVLRNSIHNLHDSLSHIKTMNQTIPYSAIITVYILNKFTLETIWLFAANIYSTYCEQILQMTMSLGIKIKSLPFAAQRVS